MRCARGSICRSFTAMESFRSLGIIDIGCGQGHVAAALRAEGFAATGIDLRGDDALYSIIEANAVVFPYPAGSVALFCRPCHGVFVEATIDQLVERDVAHVLYAGFPKNVASDLGRYRQNFRRVASRVAVDGESLYLWSRRSRKRDFPPDAKTR